nr:hypothetical protein [Acidithiobacillus sp.]
MGDDKIRMQKAIPAAIKTLIVDTLGGRIQVSWDKESSATPFGQLVYFAEFLQVSGRFEDWVEECPLIYNSPNAPKKRDVLGTLYLQIASIASRQTPVAARIYPTRLGECRARLGRPRRHPPTRRMVTKPPGGHPPPPAQGKSDTCVVHHDYGPHIPFHQALIGMVFHQNDGIQFLNHASPRMIWTTACRARLRKSGFTVPTEWSIKSSCAVKSLPGRA